MTGTEATADLCLTAFHALSKKEKEIFLEKLLQDQELREDLIDIVILEQRQKESSRSLDEYLADRKKSKG